MNYRDSDVVLNDEFGDSLVNLVLSSIKVDRPRGKELIALVVNLLLSDASNLRRRLWLSGKPFLFLSDESLEFLDPLKESILFLVASGLHVLASVVVLHSTLLLPLMELVEGSLKHTHLIMVLLKQSDVVLSKRGGMLLDVLFLLSQSIDLLLERVFLLVKRQNLGLVQVVVLGLQVVLPILEVLSSPGQVVLKVVKLLKLESDLLVDLVSVESDPFEQRSLTLLPPQVKRVDLDLHLLVVIGQLRVEMSLLLHHLIGDGLVWLNWIRHLSHQVRADIRNRVVVAYSLVHAEIG